MNVGYGGETLEADYFPLPTDNNVKVGSIIDAPLSHFNFQRHFSA